MTDQILDLGAVKARMEAKASTPEYDAGEPEIIQQVGTPADPSRPPSFSDAFDRVAANLAMDGWRVIKIERAVFMGYNEDESGGVVSMFQITAKVRRIQTQVDAS